jgi:hypothetical protein
MRDTYEIISDIWIAFGYRVGWECCLHSILKSFQVNNKVPVSSSKSLPTRLSLPVPLDASHIGQRRNPSPSRLKLSASQLASHFDPTFHHLGRVLAPFSNTAIRNLVPYLQRAPINLKHPLPRGFRQASISLPFASFQTKSENRSR